MQGRKAKQDLPQSLLNRSHKEIAKIKRNADLVQK